MYTLQVVTSRVRVTFVLDFTLAGRDTVETRDHVKDDLVCFLTPPIVRVPASFLVRTVGLEVVVDQGSRGQ